MHAYGGNSASWPATISLGDDGIDPPAWTNFNTAPTGLADRTAYYFRVGRASPTFQQSYAPPTSPLGSAISTPLTTHIVTWDTKDLRWIVAGQQSASSGATIVGRGDPNAWTVSSDGSGTWSGLTGGTFTSLVRGNEPSVSSKFYYGAYVSSGTSFLAKVDTVGAVHSLGTRPGGSANITNVQLATRSGVMVAAVGASTSGNSQVYYSTDQGTTWTAQGSTFTAGVAIQNWLCMGNPGGQVLAIPKLSGPTHYITSANGTTWVEQTTFTGALGASEVPQTLTWAWDSAYTSAWVLSTWDGSQTRFYVSYGGVTWLSVATNLPAGIKLQQVVAMTDPLVLVGLVAETPLARVLYSLDGGATWQQTATELAVNASIESLAASPNQACLVTGNLIVPGNTRGEPGGVGPA